MLNIILHPVEDIHSLHSAQSRELIMTSDGNDQVRNAEFSHRIVRSYQQGPGFAAHSQHDSTGLRLPDVQVKHPTVSLHDRIMIDGIEHWIILDSFRCLALKPVVTDAGVSDPQDRDGNAWRALNELHPGDKITVNMDSATVPVVVHSVHTHGLVTHDASVICRFPATGTRIEITHGDLVTRERTFRTGWDANAAGRIRCETLRFPPES
jgi:hypothetical protein